MVSEHVVVALQEQLDMNAQHIADDASRRLIRYFEGGAVYEAEKSGAFLVIVDEGTLLDLLNEEDRDGMEPVTVHEFDTAAERNAFLTERGWLPDFSTVV